MVSTSRGTFMASGVNPFRILAESSIMHLMHIMHIMQPAQESPTTPAAPVAPTGLRETGAITVAAVVLLIVVMAFAIISRSMRRVAERSTQRSKPTYRRDPWREAGRRMQIPPSDARGEDSERGSRDE